MKRSTKFALAAVAALGVAAVAVPVVAQQGQMQHDGMMDRSMGMMGQHGGMMGGAEEMTAGIQAELKTYDTDANGTLSLEEFAVMHAAHTRPMTVRAFQMHDADGDAQVTEAEMADMAEMMQSHMGGQQGGMQGMGQGMMDNN